MIYLCMNAQGIIWFWVPASLVVMNDIAAYVWGEKDFAGASCASGSFCLSADLLSLSMMIRRRQECCSGEPS